MTNKTPLTVVEIEAILVTLAAPSRDDSITLRAQMRRMLATIDAVRRGDNDAERDALAAALAECGLLAVEMLQKRARWTGPGKSPPVLPITPTDLRPPPAPPPPPPPSPPS